MPHAVIILVNRFALGTGPQPLWALPVYLLGAYLMAWLSYRFIESSFLKLRGRRAAARPNAGALFSEDLIVPTARD